MNPYRAYQQQRDTGMPRIELILTLFDRAQDNLHGAVLAQEQGDLARARALRVQTQLIVTSLAAGIDGAADGLAANFLRLYEYVAHQLTLDSPESLHDARAVLATLREGFEAIRAQALEMERSGAIPPLDRERMVHVTA